MYLVSKKGWELIHFYYRQYYITDDAAKATSYRRSRSSRAGHSSRPRGRNRPRDRHTSRMQALGGFQI